MTDTNLLAKNAHTMSANRNLEQRRKQEQASCVDGKLTAAEGRAASDTNSFTQKAHTSREQNCEPKRKQEQDSCKDNGVAAEVGAAIDTNSFLQNAHTQDIDTQDLCTQNTGTI